MYGLNCKNIWGWLPGRTFCNEKTTRLVKTAAWGGWVKIAQASKVERLFQKNYCSQMTAFFLGSCIFYFVLKMRTMIKCQSWLYKKYYHNIVFFIIYIDYISVFIEHLTLRQPNIQGKTLKKTRHRNCVKQLRILLIVQSSELLTVLYGRVIGINKLAFHKLNGQR